MRTKISFLLTATLVVLGIAITEADANAGTVYVMTNQAQGNSVLVFHRDSSGTLTLSASVPTQGLGTGLTLDPLESQGALAMSEDGSILAAVNPASGDITAFVVDASGRLRFGSKVSSHGALPVSVTIHNGLVYVVNQLGIANIAGFRVDRNGLLTYIDDSARALAGAALALPAEISFTPDGTQLLVTEKGTDLIDVFDVQADGHTAGPSPQKSSGHTPFGFTFFPSGTVVVTEAERRLPNKGSASSYSMAGDQLAPVSPTVFDGQTGACWTTRTGQTAWVVNTGTATISAYTVALDGHLGVANPVAASTGAGSTPIDIASTSDGTLVYVLESAIGGITGYAVSGTTLTPVFSRTGLPLSIQGLVVR